MYKSILYVCGPMMLYQVINQILKVFDLSITAQVDKTAISAVSFFSQLSNVFVSIGIGFAVGAAILIAGFFGQGDYEKVKKIVNSAMAITVLCGIILSAILIIFTDSILAFANTPDDLTQTGINYYKFEMLSLAFQYFNNMYVAIERSRGNGKMILIVNVSLSIIKVCLSALFVLVLHQSIVMIAVATLISQVLITFLGIYRLRDKSDVFGLSFAYIDLKLKNVWSMLKISLPIMIEKITLTAGKAMVNSVGVYYGTDIVGALGVSNTMSSLATTPAVSIGEGSSTIIRQNLGNDNKIRAWQCFKAVFVINVTFGLCSVIGTFFCLDFLISIFSTGDAGFATLIKEIFLIQMISNIFLTINSAVMGLLYGMGYTKVSLAINFTRLFILRLPVLLFLRYFTTIGGSTVMGLVMMISNGFTGLLAITAAVIIYKKQYSKSEVY